MSTLGAFNDSGRKSEREDSERRKREKRKMTKANKQTVEEFVEVKMSLVRRQKLPSQRQCTQSKKHSSSNVLLCVLGKKAKACPKSAVWELSSGQSAQYDS